MSGGSYDYAYSKIEDLSMCIRENDNPHRVAFKKLLRLCAEAARAIEWVDSGDYAPGDEDKPIDAALKAAGIDAQEVYKLEAFDRIRKLVEGVVPKGRAGGGR